MPKYRNKRLSFGLPATMIGPPSPPFNIASRESTARFASAFFDRVMAFITVFHENGSNLVFEELQGRLGIIRSVCAVVCPTALNSQEPAYHQEKSLIHDR